MPKKIEAELLLGKFTWDDYSKEKSKPAETIAEWVDRYEQNYWERTECNPTTERSFETGYRHYFWQLPQDKPLTLDLLRSTLLLKSPAATRSRQMYTMSYRRLAEFASSKGAIDRLELETFRIELRELRGGSVSDLLFST
ncbi:MAG: hypothetical protein HC772_19135 [Leptolyngbyaceae cyanobacterium CRU_2_3]|nr:hypothetical protein [Leptolyngbyaceae cyanobacterium CRU_2_3]